MASKGRVEVTLDDNEGFIVLTGEMPGCTHVGVVRIVVSETNVLRMIHALLRALDDGEDTVLTCGFDGYGAAGGDSAGAD